MNPRPRHKRAAGSLCFFALAALLLPAASGSADTEGAATEQLVLPAGAHLSIVPIQESGLAGIALYFPAGTAQSPDDPSLARMAPRCFLGSALEGSDESPVLESFLAESGWSWSSRCDLDGAGVFLAGPPRVFDSILRHLLSRLAQPDRVQEAQLASAWIELQEDWRRWAENPEVHLRAELARLHFGDHPYAAGQGQEAPELQTRPELQRLRGFLARRYQAGAAEILVAGNFDPEDFLARWLPDFDSLPGEAAEPLRHPEAQGTSGRLEIPGNHERAHLVLQFSGVPGASGDGAAFTLMAGVLQQLLERDLVNVGLADRASAFYDFTAPGPRPLEIQLRRFSAADRERLMALLERIFERLREGEFSEYQVISAKDLVFQRMDSARPDGDGPAAPGPNALMNWSWNVLRHELHFSRWRDSFESRVLGTSKERIAAEARKRLFLDEATLGLIMPVERLD